MRYTFFDMHTTFYRKYRSQKFDEIVGQEHIVRILKNAIVHDRLSHAYIFSGPRGTGKTSAARILAKSLNCRNGKGVQPCLKCDSCQKITSGQSVDVIEIDAASNTGVDNIRTINERVNFTPVESLYKIYIIDEVHMLSTGAFNALLKTVEEPPQNTIFILATTEPHKIPATIHSRCQHLTFRQLSLEELVGHLRFVSESEGISIDNEGVVLLAQNAGGCMRDALSLLDQAYSFNGNTITLADIRSMLGAANQESLFLFLTLFFQKDLQKMATHLKTMVYEGANLAQVLKELVQSFHQLFLIKLGVQAELIQKETADQFKTLADKLSQADIQWALDEFSKFELALKAYPNPDLIFQVKVLSWMAGPVAVPSNAPRPATTSVQSTPGASPVPSPRPTMAATSPERPPVSASASTFKLEKPTFEPPKPAYVPAPPQTVVQAKPSVSASNAASIPVSSGGNVQWQSVIEKVKSVNQALYAILIGSQSIGQTSTSIQIRLKQNFKFFLEKVKEPQNVEIIEKCILEASGQSLKFVLESDSSPSPVAAAVPSVDDSKSEGAPIQQSIAPTVSAESQKINQVIALFEGTIV